MSFVNPLTSSSSWADDEVDLAPLSFNPTQSKDEEEAKFINKDNVEYIHAENSPEDDDRSYSNPIPENGPYKAFLGNIPFSYSEDDVAHFFDGLDILSIRIPVNYETKKSRGFSYVEFGNRESLEKALSLNRMNIQGREIKVDVAQQKQNIWHGNNNQNNRGNQRNSSYNRRGSGENEKKFQNEKELPKERPRLNLLPKGTSSVESTPKTSNVTSSIFGAAKPRDEQKYLERKKSLEEEKLLKQVEPSENRSENDVEGKESRMKDGHKRRDSGGKRGGRSSGRGGGRGGKPVFERRSSTDNKSNSSGNVGGAQGSCHQERRGSYEKRDQQSNKPTRKNTSFENKKKLIIKKSGTKVQNAFSMLNDTESESDTDN